MNRRIALLGFWLMGLAGRAALACSFMVSPFCEFLSQAEAFAPGQPIVVQATVAEQLSDRARLTVQTYFLASSLPSEIWVKDLPFFDCNGAPFRGDTEAYGPVGSEILAVLQPEVDEHGQPIVSGDYTGYYLITSEHFLRLQGGQYRSPEYHQQFNTRISASDVARYLSGCLGRDVRGLTPGFQVYPVPTRDWVTFQFDLSGEHGSEPLRIVDQMGRICFEGEITSGAQVDMSTWTPGLYLAYLPRREGLKPRKLVKW